MKKVFSLLLAAVLVLALVPTLTAWADDLLRPGNQCPWCHNTGTLVFSVKDDKQHRIECNYNLHGNALGELPDPSSACGYGDVQDHFGGTATCTTGKICEACGYEYSEALDHDFSVEVAAKAPTCSEDGCTAHKECSRCGEKDGDYQVIPATGEHNWGDWRDSSVNYEKHYRSCKDCGETEAEYHSGGTATCTEGAICDKCGFEYTVPALDNHDWKWVTDKEPTCTEAGEKHEECTVHHYTKRNEGTVIDALNHDWGDWQVTVEPEVGKAGEKQRACSRCSEIETETVPALIGYSVTGGGDSTWTKGSAGEVTITVKRSEEDESCFDHYAETQIDGKAATVSAKAGSTVVTIGADALDKLSAGTHTVTVVFDDGEAETTVTIKEKPADNKTDDKKEEKKEDKKEGKKNDSKQKSPRTGDEAVILPWALLLGMSMAGLGVARTAAGRRRKTKR